jgi:hypothetical protein
MQRALLSTAPLVIGLLAGGSLEVHHTDSFVGIERIKIRWDAGDIEIRAHEGDTVRAEKQAWGPEAPLAYSVRRDQEILTLELSCRTPAPCGGDLALSVPEGVDIELDLGEGHASLTGGLGDLSVIVGSGEIEAWDLQANEAVLQVVEGDIAAGWATVPQRIVVATVTGDVDLRLPEADYDLEDQLGHSSFVGMRQVDGAASKVQVTTLNGHADIHGVRSMASL